MKITLTVCDVCEATPTKAYRIEQDGRKADVDLCAAHAQPFEAYLTKSATPPSTARQRPAKKAAAKKSAKQTAAQKKVYTIEEIEALKKPK